MQFVGIEKLSLREKFSMGSVKYRPVCYEELKALVESKRLASAYIEGKVADECPVQGVSPSPLTLRYRLSVNSPEKAEAELQSFLGQAEMDGGCLSQLLDYELLLESERGEFRTATVNPVWQLMEDLRCRLAKLGCDTLQRPHQAQEWGLVLQQVQSVKDQQAAIVEKLRVEYQELEQEISVLGIEVGECLCVLSIHLLSCEHTGYGIWHCSVQERLTLMRESPSDPEPIPDEILHSESPYPDLKAALLHEFMSLSMQYGARLEGVRSRLGDTDRNCGWPAEDHLVFQMVVSQYPPDLPKHRALYMDMLQRLLPHRSREDLNDHERLWDWYRFTQAQERAVLRSWRRDRADLLAKSLLTLEESWLAHQQEQATQSDRMRRQEICTQLREKLQEWRAHQEEVAQLEAALAASRQQEEEEKLRRKQEREMARRTVQKERIQEHRCEKQRRREELEKRNVERLERLKALMAEQARKDRERKPWRLCPALTALLSLHQVAVLAEADPARMMGDTEASKNRHHMEEEFLLQKPLYDLHTYTDTQIMADPRVRIEKALREAGLHETLYAKEVLSSVRPPRPARRDTESTAFSF
ncbi:coiled-coil domain-containing protein 148-like [Scleropages formosus]|uniref:Coiled-coil domain-containing protein 148-like n=1 Tax=Scleropages formosus TaxID=113540 RepID=A0A0N8K131_SCLFO|nr:coiled-coil domain-containing protein 148-like [Scleropages formosus]